MLSWPADWMLKLSPLERPPSHQSHIRPHATSKICVKARHLSTESVSWNLWVNRAWPWIVAQKESRRPAIWACCKIYDLFWLMRMKWLLKPSFARPKCSGQPGSSIISSILTKQVQIGRYNYKHKCEVRPEVKKVHQPLLVLHCIQSSSDYSRTLSKSSSVFHDNLILKTKNLRKLAGNLQNTTNVNLQRAIFGPESI